MSKMEEQTASPFPEDQKALNINEDMVSMYQDKFQVEAGFYIYQKVGDTWYQRHTSQSLYVCQEIGKSDDLIDVLEELKKSKLKEEQLKKAILLENKEIDDLIVAEIESSEGPWIIEVPNRRDRETEGVGDFITQEKGMATLAGVYDADTPSRPDAEFIIKAKNSWKKIMNQIVNIKDILFQRD